jgi:hypothetical protein
MDVKDVQRRGLKYAQRIGALHFAENVGDATILLDMGMDPNELFPTRFGTVPPLWGLIEHDYLDVARVLLERGADPNVCCGNNVHLIDRAMSFAAIRLLRRYGSRPVSKPERTRPLHQLDLGISCLLVLCRPVFQNRKQWITRDCLRLLSDFIQPEFPLWLSYMVNTNTCIWDDEDGTRYEVGDTESLERLKDRNIQVLTGWNTRFPRFSLSSLSVRELRMIDMPQEGADFSHPYWPQGIKRISMYNSSDDVTGVMTSVTSQVHVRGGKDPSEYRSTFPNTRLFVVCALLYEPKDKTTCDVYIEQETVYMTGEVYESYFRCTPRPSPLMEGSLVNARTFEMDIRLVAEFVRTNPAIHYMELMVHVDFDETELDRIEEALCENYRKL